MNKQSVLDDLTDDYKREFGCGDQRDSVSEGVEKLFYRLGREDPQYDGSGYRLILRNDLCSFPELDYLREGGIVGKDNHLIVDPNPIFTSIRKRREEKGLSPIPCDRHYEMNRVIEFLTNTIPKAPFFHRLTEINPDLSGSSRGFFFDDPTYSRFNVSDYAELVEREIESLSDDMFIEAAFRNPMYRYNVDLDEDVTKDIVKETLLTYFSRFELNSEINAIVHEYSPRMARKLYSKEIGDTDDLERVVSQLFVAHDWLSDKREEWLKNPERYANILGSELNTADHLQGGDQMLLLEIVPGNIDSSKKLEDYPFGQDIRMIHETEYQREGNFVQAMNLGDQMKYLAEMKDMEELREIASRARGFLNDYLRKLPIIAVRYDVSHKGQSLFD